MKRIAAQRMLGRAIRQMRQSRGLSRPELARMCGLTSMKMWRIENGRVNPMMSTLLRLSRQLDTTIEDLVKGIE